MLVRFLSFVILLLVLPPLSMWAQKPTGLLDDDENYAQQPIMSQYDGSKASDLPSKVSLKSNCPMPGNQGEIPSCVGWSIGYGAFTIERAIQNGWTDTKFISEEAFSALFIYNQIKEKTDCKSPSSMSHAMDWLKNNGNCFAKEFDFNVSDCSQKPDNRLIENAKQYKLKEFVRLFDKDAGPTQKINTLRALLAKKKPVIISLRINKQFMMLKNTDFWYPQLGDIPSEGHAITVIGYDDEIGYFQLLNSWGKGWGNEGFIKIKYKDLAQYCRYAYAIYLKTDNSEPLDFTETPTVKQNISSEKAIMSSPKTIEKPQKTISEEQSKPVVKSLTELAGQFEINEYKGKSNTGELLFETAKVERTDNHYNLKRKDWQVGQLFQLALTSEFSGAYVYVLSLNPKNEIKVLYPRNEEYGQQYKGLHETPLIMLDGARVVLPNPKSAIRIEHTGTDRLCIFFSFKKINNLTKVCELIKKGENDFEKRIHQLLGEAMIPLSDTVFEDKKIAFSASTRSAGAIVPIIIEFQSQ